MIVSSASIGQVLSHVLGNVEYLLQDFGIRGLVSVEEPETDGDPYRVTYKVSKGYLYYAEQILQHRLEYALRSMNASVDIC